ncbi:MAG TPA: phosphotransferase, partial [Xanthobacteraceae bacterium]|nr:phosphotransferase [Xanthobacteraceae bacterium]
QAEEAGEIGDTLNRDRLAAMMEGWARVQAIADRELPLIPSHNDLAPGNTCQLAAEGGDPRFVFIDWEAFGLNFAGADLHHFLRLAIVNPAYAPFFEELRRRYFERMHDVHGYDCVATDIGAHVYALYRSMLRAVNKKKGSELHVAMAIYAKLTTLLGLTSSDVNLHHTTK